MSHPGRVEGKVAIVTGGAKGLGEADCRVLTSHGAKVVVADVDETQGRALADELAFETVLMDSWYLSEELVKTLAEQKKDWVSLLKKNRNVESHSFTLRDADGQVIKFSKPHIKVENLVPLIPKRSYKKVRSGAGWGLARAARARRPWLRAHPWRLQRGKRPLGRGERPRDRLRRAVAALVRGGRRATLQRGARPLARADSRVGRRASWGIPRGPRAAGTAGS